MPFCIVLTVVVGTALGWLLVKITRVPHHLKGLVLGCCAVGMNRLYFFFSFNFYIYKGYTCKT